MNSRTTVLACGVLSLLLSLQTSAQSNRTENTYRLDDPDNRPPATLADVAWLTGSWEGEAFGSRFEEVWNAPSAGSMVGMFKVFNDEGVSFYEILLMIEEEGSVSLKVKHFTKDFVSWETKEEYVTFRFISADEEAIHFSGISFYRIDDDTMHGFLAMRSGDEVREEKLVYRRR